MRIVAMADTHTFTDEPSFTVPEGDVLLHAGDLLRAGSFDEFEVELRWLRSLPHGVKVLVAGNHDHCIFRKRKRAEKMMGMGICYLQDSGFESGGVRFWGSPWQPEFFDLAFNLPRGPKLAEKWALIPDETDVLITHGPARGLGDLVAASIGGGPEQRAGCDDLLVALDRVQPRLHVFGHIHEDRGVWTHGKSMAANVTTNECEYPPMVFDVNPVTGEVTVVST